MVYLGTMRILFLSRSTLWSQVGGDTIQVEQTAQALREKGHQIEIILSGQNVSGNYDLVHFFNLGRPQDALPYLQNIDIPWVTSTLWVDYSSSDSRRTGILGTVLKRLSPSGQEYLKSLARGIMGRDQIPHFSYLIKGHTNTMRQIILRSKALICSTQTEGKRIETHFKSTPPIHTVSLGISDVFWNTKKHNTSTPRSGVICVGRFEVLKNQKTLISVLAKNNIPALFVGSGSGLQGNYYQECLKAAEGTPIRFVDHVSQGELSKLYQGAKTVVIPSFFETFGLSGIEGLASGCTLAVSNTLDSFEEYQRLGAETFSPDSPAEMEKALRASLSKFTDTKDRLRKSKYTWSHAANELESIYKKVLKTE